MDKVLIYEHTLKIRESDILEDGRIRLVEETILDEGQIKIWVNSRESGCHNIPHIHASFNDKDYSIAIDGTNKLLAPEKEDRFYRFIVRGYFKDYHMQEYRDYWNNKTDSRMKFVLGPDGKYSSQYSYN